MTRVLQVVHCAFGVRSIGSVTRDTWPSGTCTCTMGNWSTNKARARAGKWQHWTPAVYNSSHVCVDILLLSIYRVFQYTLDSKECFILMNQPFASGLVIIILTPFKTNFWDTLCSRYVALKTSHIYLVFTLGNQTM